MKGVKRVEYENIKDMGENSLMKKVRELVGISEVTARIRKEVKDPEKKIVMLKELINVIDLTLMDIVDIARQLKSTKRIVKSYINGEAPANMCDILVDLKLTLDSLRQILDDLMREVNIYSNVCDIFQ